MDAIIQDMEKNRNFLKDNLIRLRNKAGLTQDELANSAHITLTGYQKIEYGKSSGKAKTISDLAKALGVKVEDLYKDPNEKTVQKPSKDDDYNALIKKIDSLQVMTPEGIAEIVAQKLAENKASVSKQDTKNMSEKDKLILSIRSRLAALDYDELRTIDSAIDDLISIHAPDPKATIAD